MSTKLDWYTASERDLDVLQNERRFIPDEVFGLVRKWSNTPTADFLPTRVVDGVKQFLLTRRAERPWIGEWFIPGGRIPPGRKATQGCERNCERELGFTPDSMRFVDDYPLLNPECQHGGDPYFTLMNLFEIPITEQQANAIKRDKTAKEMKWFAKIEPHFPTPMKEILAKIGFSE